ESPSRQGVGQQACLRPEVGFCGPFKSSGIRHAKPAERDDFSLDVRRVQVRVVQPRIPGHDRTGRCRARLLHMEEVPRRWILATLWVQIWSVALRTPEERVVVDELS